MSDEIYDQMTYDGEQHVSLLTYPEIRDRLILLNGWSKTYAMTGWRLGYSVWPGSSTTMCASSRSTAWSCVNAPTQFAGLAALDRPQDAVAKMVRRVRQAPQARGRRAEQAARRLLHHAEGRVLRLPQRQAAPAGRPSRSPRACWRTQASPPSAARISASSARAICASPTPTRRRTSSSALDRMGDFLASRKAA